MNVVAHAIDEAGNVGQSSDPMTGTLDVVGPTIVVVDNTGMVMRGLVTDSSGVASVEVSLDGGVSILPAELWDSTWTFSGATWPWPRQEFAILRARDAAGNFASEAVSLLTIDVYVPIVFRGR